MYELDHIFICTEPGAPEAGALREFGLSEGPESDHEGQGTRSRSFLFGNAAMDLLWVEDERAAKHPRTTPTRLFDRWNSRKSHCPFGIGIRPKEGESPKAPFPGWAYVPRYLNEGERMVAAQNSDLIKEPLALYLPFATPPERCDSAFEEHAAGFSAITRIHLVLPEYRPESTVMKALAGIGGISLSSGDDYRLEMGFDGEITGKRHAFDTLPLTFFW